MNIAAKRAPFAAAAPLPHDALGRPLHDLRLSVIEACNFRCPSACPPIAYRRITGWIPRHE